MNKIYLALYLLFFVVNISIAQDKYFLVFKANPPSSHSLAGHAFVSFVKQSQAKKQTIVENTWGFFPIEGDKAKRYKALFSEEGRVKPTDIGDLGEADFIVETDLVVYEYCKRMRWVWADKRYGAIITNNNCIDFVTDIASRVLPVLNVPRAISDVSPKLWLPEKFLNELKARNLQIDSLARISLTKINPPKEPEKTPGVSPAPDRPTVVSKSNANTNNLLGGSTPAELGMILLNAVKNNDRQIYFRCINPNVTEDSYNDMKEDFESLRSWFEDNGVINWKDVTFSRIRCQTRMDGNIKVAAFFHIEFTYKKFLGSLSMGSARSIPGGDKYLLSGGFAKGNSQFYPVGAFGGR